MRKRSDVPSACSKRTLFPPRQTISIKHTLIYSVTQRSLGHIPWFTLRRFFGEACAWPFVSALAADGVWSLLLELASRKCKELSGAALILMLLSVGLSLEADDSAAVLPVMMPADWTLNLGQRGEERVESRADWDRVVSDGEIESQSRQA